MLTNNCDFHIHTINSRCAKKDEMTIGKIVRECISKDIKICGITDHIHADTDVTILQKNRTAINNIFSSETEIFLGCEADVLDVGLCTVDEYVCKNTDFIAVSANHFTAPQVSAPSKNASNREIAAYFLKMLRYACSLNFVDIIVHPLYVFPKTYDVRCMDTLEDDELTDVILLAKENNIAFELTPRAMMLDNIHFMQRFYYLCKQNGALFSIGSDAHALKTIGATLFLNEFLRELCISDEDLWHIKRGLKK